MIIAKDMIMLTCWHCEYENRYPNVIEDPDREIFICDMCGEVIFALGMRTESHK